MLVRLLRDLCFVLVAIVFLSDSFCKAQIIVNKKITVLKNGEVVDRYALNSFNNKDTLQFKIEYEIQNNTSQKLYIKKQLQSFADGERRTGGYSASEVAAGGTTKGSHGPTVGFLGNVNNTFEYRWIISCGTESDLRSADESAMVPVPDGQISVMFFKEPLTDELKVAETEAPVEHPANWQKLGCSQILDGIYGLRKNGTIKLDSKLSKVLDAKGTAYGYRFIQLGKAWDKGEMGQEQHSLALAVAKKQLYESVAKEMEPELLADAIELATRMSFSRGGKSHDPGDIAYLANPVIVERLKLTQQQQGQLKSMMEAIVKHRSEAEGKLKKRLDQIPPNQKNDDFKSLVKTHQQQLNQDAIKTFEQMLAILTEQQRLAYENLVGLKSPIPYRYVEKKQ